MLLIGSSQEEMSESTVRELFRNLERTLHERLQCIEEVLVGQRSSTGSIAATAMTNTEVDNMRTDIANMGNTMNNLLETVRLLRTEVDELRERRTGAAAQLLPLHPLEGLELVPKREMSIPMTELSVADRLLLNKRARKALEAQEMGEKQFEDYPEVEAGADESVIGNEGDDDMQLHVTKGTSEAAGSEVEAAEEEEETEEAVEEETEEAVEEETEEAEEEEGEALELEEFEYKGSTYYRDPENNVYMMDEEGELVDEPIGVWSEVKKRIVVRKAA
jgi:cobalamin biosynthesis protein CobT